VQKQASANCTNAPLPPRVLDARVNPRGTKTLSLSASRYPQKVDTESCCEGDQLRELTWLGFRYGKVVYSFSNARSVQKSSARLLLDI